MGCIKTSIYDGFLEVFIITFLDKSILKRKWRYCKISTFILIWNLGVQFYNREHILADYDEFLLA